MRLSPLTRSSCTLSTLRGGPCSVCYTAAVVGSYTGSWTCATSRQCGYLLWVSTGVLGSILLGERSVIPLGTSAIVAPLLLINIVGGEEVLNGKSRGCIAGSFPGGPFLPPPMEYVLVVLM